MEAILADYEAVFPYLHASSYAISTQDYREKIPIETVPVELDFARIEYSRLFEEIEFLVRHWNPEETPSPLLLVQGSYPANHYRILTMLFPSITIALWGVNNTRVPDDAHQWERIEVFTEDLTVQTCLDKYKRDDVLFVCYRPLNATIPNREGMYLEFWNTEMDYQTSLVKALQPLESNLSFLLPALDKNEQVTYYRSYITPSCLTSEKDDAADRIYRCVPIKEKELLVQCNYLVDWFDQVLNYWNLVAKKGRLLRNSLTKTSYIHTINGILFFGIELCRVVDILHSYLLFSGQIDTRAIESTILNQITDLLQAITRNFKELHVEYSLVEHSKRYSPTNMEETYELQPAMSVDARINLLQDQAFLQARERLLSPEETLVDLTL